MSGVISGLTTQRSVPQQSSTPSTPTGAPFSARLAATGVSSLAAPATSLGGGAGVSGQSVIQSALGGEGQLGASIKSEYGTDSAAQLAAMLRVQMTVQRENQWFTTLSNVEKGLETKPITSNFK